MTMFRKQKHPQYLGLIPLEGLIPPFAYPEGYVVADCLDCHARWGNESMDKLFQDMAWHHPRHIIHVWDSTPST